MPSPSLASLSLFVSSLAVVTNTDVQAFQQHHSSQIKQSHCRKKPETTATLASAVAAIATISRRSSNRVAATTILGAEAANGEDDRASVSPAAPPEPLSSLIGGLSSVPTQRPKVVAGAGDYDKAEVRSMVERWIKDETVLILSTSTCPYCNTVKEMFRSKGIRFRAEEIDGRQDIRAEMAELIGRTSVPAVFVNGEYIGGCNDGGRGGVLPLEESGELDRLLSDAGVIQ